MYTWGFVVILFDNLIAINLCVVQLHLCMMAGASERAGVQTRLVHIAYTEL